MKLKNILYTICFLSVCFSCIDDPEFDSGVHNAEKPEIGEVIISGRDKTASTVTLKSTVLEANGYPVTERGFIWNTDSVVPPVNDKDKWWQVGEGVGEYTDTIKKLSPGVLYYFWSYAKNKINTSYSKFDSTRTDSGLGRLKTYVIDEGYTYATHAKVSAKINVQGEGKTIVRGFHYSNSETPENIIRIESKTPFEQDSFVCELSGLSPGKKYNVQAFVTNEVSDVLVTTTSTAVDLNTGDGKPVVGGILKLNPGYSYVDVISQIIHQGDTVLEERGFCWGTTSTPIFEIDSARKANGNHIGSLAMTIENLVPEQQYFVRAYAKNKYGISYGEPQAFYVKNDKPTVQTLESSYDYDAGTVFVNGLIYDKGKSEITSRGVCYSITFSEPTLFNGTPYPISSTSDNFSKNISGLKGGTKYYIRAYATNSEGTSYGGVKVITTPNALIADSDNFPGSSRLTGSSAYFMYGNKGYLLGGDKGASYTDELWSYNTDTRNWQPLKSQSPAKWQSVVVHGNSAYSLGGLGSGSMLLDDFRRYSFPGNTWGDTILSLPDSAYLRVGFTLGDAAYFIGGMGDTTKNEVWSYNFNPSGWVRKSDFPVKQYGGIALNIGDEIYAGMGKDGADNCNKTIWKLNSVLFTWTKETDNSLISGEIIAGAALNKKIYLIEKEIDDSLYIHEYDLLSKTWTKKSRISKSGQDVHGMFVIDDKIYIGLINNKMYRYNPLWDN